MHKDKIKIATLKSTPFVLYGAGYCGTAVCLMLEEEQLRPVAFCDKRRSGIEPGSGLPIIAPEELNGAYSDVKILVTSIDFADEILRDIKALGIDEGRIYSVNDFNLNP